MEYPLLDVRCSECRGFGAMYVRPGEWDGLPEGGDVTCGVCDGAQRVPTEFGNSLLAFLDRHGITATEKE